MKALEKDRTRRYETASGFAADVQRYLSDEPIKPGRHRGFIGFANSSVATRVQSLQPSRWG